jgi:hypothetical protein
MRALAPWRGTGTLRQEMERVFDRFLEPRWDELEGVGAWAPKLDFSETKDAFMVNASEERDDPDALHDRSGGADRDRDRDDARPRRRDGTCRSLPTRASW